MNSLDALILDQLPASELSRFTTPLDSAPRLREVWIAIRTDGIPVTDPDAPVIIGDGTRSNPWDASVAAKFDFILRTLVGQNTIVHLGLGVFRSNGGQTNPGSIPKWTPKSGQKLVGAGVYQTVLLLSISDPPPTTDGIYGKVLIHSNQTYLEGFEISDLTLDAGMDDQPMPAAARNGWPQIMTGVLALQGENILIRNVRMVNYGTRATLDLAGRLVNGVEGFTCKPGALVDDANISFNQVVEDCLFEQPYHSNGRENTPITSGTAEPAGTAKGMAMRRNYLNSEFINRSAHPGTMVARVIYNSGMVTIGGVTYGAGLVQTIETMGPHNVKAGAVVDGKPTGVHLGNVPRPFYVEIAGASGNTAYNGRFLVVSPETNDGSSRTLQILMSSDPGSTLPTGKMTLRDSPSPTMDVVSLVRETAPSLDANVTTAVPHKRLAGEWVVISGAVDNGATTNVYNGSFQISSVTSSTVFKVRLAAAPSSATASGMIALDRRPPLGVRVSNLKRTWGNSWIIETYGPHWRKPNEWILLTNISVSDGTLPNAFHSYLRVDRVIDPTHFEITIENPTDLADYFDLLDEEINESVYDPVTSVFGVFATNQQPYQLGYAPLTVIERNRVMHASHGGNYHDTWTEVDHIARKNYHYGVYRGVYENLLGSIGVWGDLFQAFFPNKDEYFRGILNEAPTTIPGGYSLKLKCAKNATTPGKNPRIPAGCAVFLTNHESAPTEQTFGVVTAVTPPNPPTDDYYYLTISVAANPFGSTVGKVIWFWKLYQGIRFTQEENIYDLAHYPLGGSTIPPAAFFLTGHLYGQYQIANARFFTFMKYCLRGNLIRQIDNIPDPLGLPYFAQGIRADNVKELIAEDNVINLATTPFLYERSERIKCLNNQSSSGRVVTPVVFPFDTLKAPTVISEDPFDTYDDWLLGF